MPFDYKKEYKEFYLPRRKKPQIITVPAMNFVAVHGKGNPNDPAGGIQGGAMELLYGIAFTIKMSCKGNHKMDGYFEYVVPPLEGLVASAGAGGRGLLQTKRPFIWTSMIRLPEFVTRPEGLTGQCRRPRQKKKDFSKVEFLPTMKVCACSVCISAPYDEDRKAGCGSWMRLQRSRDIARIFQTHASTTRFIWGPPPPPPRGKKNTGGGPPLKKKKKKKKKKNSFFFFRKSKNKIIHKKKIKKKEEKRIMQHETVIVLDFGGQYNQLIARRVRENNVYCEIYSYKTDLSVIKAKNPKGIIFTGGPNSVYLEDSPTIDPEIFNWGVPVLGICYGSQLMMHLLGGHVCRAPEREYGKTEVFVDNEQQDVHRCAALHHLLDEPQRLH